MSKNRPTFKLSRISATEKPKTRPIESKNRGIRPFLEIDDPPWPKSSPKKREYFDSSSSSSSSEDESLPVNRGSSRKQRYLEQILHAKALLAGNEASLDNTSRLQRAAEACFPTVNPNTVTPREMITRMQEHLHVTSFSPAETAWIQSYWGQWIRQSLPALSQPDTETLHTVVDRVFERIASSQPDALLKCTVKQFMDDAQKEFGGVFKRSTREKAKARIVSLIQQRQALCSNKENESSGKVVAKKASVRNESKKDKAKVLPPVDIDDSSPEVIRKQPKMESKKPSLPVAPAVPAASKQAPMEDDDVQIVETKAEVKRKRVAAATKGTRKRSRTGKCPLCTNCPCALTHHDGDASPGFAKSDTEIERALIRRQQKLEVTIDQYEEKAEAVRRELKKHRRNVYKRREKILQKGAERRKEQTIKEMFRFLPDAEELDSKYHKQTTQTKMASKLVTMAQKKMFPNPKPVVQKTLTQFLKGTDETPTADNEAVETGTSPDLDVPTEGRPILTAQDDGEVSLDDTPEEDDFQCYQSPLRLQRIDLQVAQDKKPSPIHFPLLWDAVRNGNYDCLWDHLFHESTDDTGVEHLLNLLGDTDAYCEHQDEQDHATFDDHPCNFDDNCIDAFEEPVVGGDCSPSALSTRGRSMAESLIERVQADGDLQSKLNARNPQWQENVRFAMFQTDKDDVLGALAKLCEKQAFLHRFQQKFLDRMVQEQALLGVFEEALLSSSSRLSTNQTCDSTMGEKHTSQSNLFAE